MAHYYDKDGTPIADTLSWAKLLEDRDYGRVEEDTLGEARISTVWLGLDHGYGGPPLIFETRVFGGPLDMEQERYSTLEEAKAGHAAMVAKVKEAT